MATWSWIVIVLVVVVIIAAAAVLTRQRRTAALRQRFGTEYDRTVAASDNPRTAEAELRNRERERKQLDIKPLDGDARARYAGEWRAVQERFVDQPAEATQAADTLLHKVMAERGYPMQDFEKQSDLVSVDHPAVVDNYRVAHGIRTRSQDHPVSTEDLREAMLRYRSLFTEMLGDASNDGDIPASSGTTSSDITGPSTTGPADRDPADQTTVSPPLDTAAPTETPAASAAPAPTAANRTEAPDETR